MGVVLLITFLYCAAVWLVFFKFKWMVFTMAWAVVSVFVGIHLLLAFVIGLRFVTPYSSNATVVQHTVQLIPRLPEPTLLTAVLVTPNVPVKKGQPLFQFDRRPYEYKVRQLEAEIQAARHKAAAKRSQIAAGESKVKQLERSWLPAQHDTRILETDVEMASFKTSAMNSELEFARLQSQRFQDLAKQNAGPVEDSQKWSAQVQADEASVKEAYAGVERARLRYPSQIGGVNTIVASAEARLKEGQASVEEAQASLHETIATVGSLEAQLETARYYLDNTTMLAPEDGRIVNLRGIAAFICDADRYVLATFFQENLKYMKLGQPVEVAFALYPGQIFKGNVSSI